MSLIPPPPSKIKEVRNISNMDKQRIYDYLQGAIYS